MNETKSAWFSKINWTQIVAMIAMIGTVFGIDVPEDVRVQLLAAIGGIQGVATWIFRTWFTKKAIA
jgi:hypothetical protein